MKRTEDDRLFGEEFARRLLPRYEAARAAGKTAEDFARQLGIKRGGLQKYLRATATPSLRTVVLAYREFGIAIPYGGTNFKLILKKRGRSRAAIAEIQMKLPFTIEAPEAEIDVVIRKKTAQRYRFDLQIRKAL